jgi:DNA-directed RNA polymerase specialized sigma24 family protein
MPADDGFEDLVGRVRAGDQDAADELARMFEPFVLRYVRFAMRKRRNYPVIHSRFGSSDVCQSVLASLFVGLRDGRFELKHPEQVERLLRVMSRFKIGAESRKLSVILRELIDRESALDQADSGPGPEKTVDDKDLVEAVVNHFTGVELGILQRRLDGDTWPAIAAQLGESAEALRKTLARAIDRVKNMPAMRAALPN